jgi:hypothetical protein
MSPWGARPLKNGNGIPVGMVIRWKDRDQLWRCRTRSEYETRRKAAGILEMNAKIKKIQDG